MIGEIGHGIITVDTTLRYNYNGNWDLRYKNVHFFLT